ncbi:hypothetical protein L9F63_016036, partial [Diploptera punctata]
NVIENIIKKLFLKFHYHIKSEDCNRKQYHRTNITRNVHSVFCHLESFILEAASNNLKCNIENLVDQAVKTNLKGEFKNHHEGYHGQISQTPDSSVLSRVFFFFFFFFFFLCTLGYLTNLAGQNYLSVLIKCSKEQKRNFCRFFRQLSYWQKAVLYYCRTMFSGQILHPNFCLPTLDHATPYSSLNGMYECGCERSVNGCVLPGSLSNNQ